MLGKRVFKPFEIRGVYLECCHGSMREGLTKKDLEVAAKINKVA
jgi:hypothetical protein